MKRVLLLCLMTLLSVVMWAQTTFTYNYIKYNILDATTCEVGSNLKSTEVPAGDLFIPETAYDDYGNEYTVIGLGEEAFSQLSLITSVDIPNTVTYIGYRAFYNCSNLDGINVPSSVKSIGEDAFRGNRKMTYITLNEGLVSIGAQAFGSCVAVEELTIPSTIEELGDYMCWGMEGVKEIKIFASLTKIPANCFNDCSALESINIPETVTSIESQAFWWCLALKGVTLPEGLESIGGGDNQGAFGWCSSLESITIPDNVSLVDENAFYECSNLKEVIVGNSIQDINKTVFKNCTSLKSVTLGSSVKNIYVDAFQNCTSLEEITIPASVEFIEHAAFIDCSSLSKIYSLNTTPPEVQVADPENGAFTGIAEECVLYVPEGTYNSYSTAYGWEDFFIVEMTDFAIETLAATDITYNSATLNGSVTAAYYDPITEKGFEYWAEGGELERVVVSGEEMVVTVTDLEPNTTYSYHAYAMTENGTEFGEEMTFTTSEIPDGIRDVYINCENIEYIYSIKGEKLTSLVKGINVVRYTNGTSKKILIK